VPAEARGEHPDLVHPAGALEPAVDLLDRDDVGAEAVDRRRGRAEVDPAGVDVDPVQQVVRRDAQRPPPISSD
jgi:hypothetical protein